MPTGTLRRKIILPVIVIRKNGEQHTAHTLELSDASVRLGGFATPLVPGEVVEIQHGSAQGKFQVFWMGPSGSAMEGQAGMRSLEPGNSIWEGRSVRTMKEDTPCSVTPAAQPARKKRANEKRGHDRYECSGAAAVRSQGSKFPVNGLIKDISEGGIYIEMTSPLPVNAPVVIKATVDGVVLEGEGVVCTSYPMVGMGVRFQNLSRESQERLAKILEKSGHKPAEAATGPVAAVTAEPNAALRLDAYAIRVLPIACQTVAANLEAWKSAHTTAELDELFEAVQTLYQKLSADSVEKDRNYVTTMTRLGAR
jgi:hypothetical protein